MKLAHELALAILPSFRSRFSRHDFTLAQLFACLVLREHMKLTYRRLVALLKDNDWCERLGMTRVPSTATLCRAFEFLIAQRHLHDALDVLIGSAKPYGQRAQVETTLSMIKRNLGGYLRARTSVGREMEMMFKAVVHNLMVV